MPCDQLKLIQLNLDQNTSPEMLMKALESMGLNPVARGNMIYFGNGESYNTTTGQLNVQPGRTVEEIKEAIGGEIVKSQAKKWGYKVKKVGNNQYELQK